MKIHTKKIPKGFTLIELLVAIFIFSMVTVAIVSVFVSATAAHQKARAIKTVKDNVEFAMNTIAKDVRMGQVVGGDGSRAYSVVLNRNRGGSVCYKIYGAGANKTTLGSCDSACSNCNPIVDLSGMNLKFDDLSGFSAQSTSPVASPTVRGYVEMNFNILPIGSLGMDSDAINVQTTVSSRDYGWQ